MRGVSVRGAAFAIAAAALMGSTVLAAQQDSRVPPAESAPTYAKDVAPILNKNCVSCHRPGEIAPMSFLTYGDVRPWAKAIKEKTAAGVMPPWGADPHYGKFRNDRSLSPKEIATIAAWANAGARQGNPADLPPTPTFPEGGWTIGKPDVVFDMPVEYQIPADGAVEYQYFEVPTNFKQDMWMQAGEVRAGDPTHVHHIIVSVIEPGKDTRPNVVQVQAIGAGGGFPGGFDPSKLTAAQRAAFAANLRRASAVMLVNWAVGEDAPIYPAGYAKRIPAGSTLVFQIHYTTNGAPGRDRSKIGLIFAKQPPKQEIRTGMILNAGFAIPANEPNHLVEAEATFTDDVKVWTMHPHMHLRGKDMQYTATYPDGKSEVLLSVPKYDFAWQCDYWLAEPVRLPKGSKIRVTAHFDNSKGNYANPNPGETVRWGDQTWEEMMIGFFTYTVEGTAAPTTAGGPR